LEAQIHLEAPHLEVLVLTQTTMPTLGDSLETKQPTLLEAQQQAPLAPPQALALEAQQVGVYLELSQPTLAPLYLEPVILALVLLATLHSVEQQSNLISRYIEFHPALLSSFNAMMTQKF